MSTPSMSPSSMGAPTTQPFGPASGNLEGFPEAIPVPTWKRVLDVFLLLMVLPVVGPVFLLAAAWVSLVSHGPLLFVQERVGRGGRRFKCFKLRTMQPDCSTASHQQHLKQILASDKPMQKLDTVDPRLLPGAKILRALGIDELPQLYNVFRGEMSVVGPRPCIPYEAQQFQPWQRERFAGLPGMTGLWQVRGKNRTTFLEMIRLDIEYVRTQSLWLDLRILVATPKALMLQLVYALWNRAQTGRQRLSRSQPVPIATADGSGVVG
ncbi:MAG: sugar transferase [Verrucomicrobiae bacterium]|nr:sugar transferase [Verrucomicrobiae bacterium]